MAPPRRFDSGLFLSCLAISIGAWTIIGAFGFTHWPRDSDDRLDFVEVLTLTLGIPAYFFSLIAAHSELQYHPSLSVRPAALFIAATLGFSFTAAFCIATVNQRGVFQHTFLIMGSVYVGCMLELVTGVITSCVQKMGGSSKDGYQVVARSERTASSN